MTPERFLQLAIEPAVQLLPIEMGSLQAKALILAIGLQESGLANRRQINGPARGMCQFEIGGVRAVMGHSSCVAALNAATSALSYPYDATTLYVAIEHNDILAAIFARLLLWSSSRALPPSTAPEDGWQAYVQTWRPGKPRREDWDAHFTRAWEVVHGPH